MTRRRRGRPCQGQGRPQESQAALKKIEAENRKAMSDAKKAKKAKNAKKPKTDGTDQKDEAWLRPLPARRDD